MEYTYTTDVFEDNVKTRRNVTMNFTKVISDLDGFTTFNVEVFDNLKSKVVCHLTNVKDIREWQDFIKGVGIPSPKWNILEILHELEEPPVLKDPSNPPHYKHYMRDMQWLEVIMEVYKDETEKVVGFLEIQISKYLSRIGKKDPYLQDCRKLRWYAIFLEAYVAAGHKPIKIDDYPALKG